MRGLTLGVVCALTLAFAAMPALAKDGYRVFEKGEIFEIQENQKGEKVTIGYMVRCGCNRLAELRVDTEGNISHRGWVSTLVRHSSWTPSTPVWLTLLGENRTGRLIKDYTQQEWETMDWFDPFSYVDEDGNKKIKPTGEMFPADMDSLSDAVASRLSELCG